jgi:hypothetical protein
MFHAFDPAAPRVDVAPDGAHELLWNHDFDVPHQLEQHGLAFFTASFSTMEPANLRAISFESTS